MISQGGKPQGQHGITWANKCCRSTLTTLQELRESQETEVSMSSHTAPRDCVEHQILQRTWGCQDRSLKPWKTVCENWHSVDSALTKNQRTKIVLREGHGSNNNPERSVRSKKITLDTFGYCIGVVFLTLALYVYSAIPYIYMYASQRLIYLALKLTLKHVRICKEWQECH